MKRIRSRKPRYLAALLGGAVLLLAGGVAAALAVERLGVTPRALGPYIAQRAAGHNPTIEAFGRFASFTLLELDRGSAAVAATQPQLILGAQPRAVESVAGVGIPVGSGDELRAAMAQAQPGDVITLLPGTYRINGGNLNANRPGRADAPITVRAGVPDSVHLEFTMVEGFLVSAPYWRFENLSIRGVCPSDEDCEHAFHVVGAASHFTSINNTIADFNAHFKINGAEGRFPDDGLIESNTLENSRVRATARPVTPIDMVAASRWTIRSNLIADFIKGAGNQVSYGAYAKGAGNANLFERNVVWCERRLQGHPGQRVGLSLGGGGTGREFCRDGRCISEQQDSILRANLVVGCSDVGIYLNSAAASTLDDNTLIDTSGIDVRFPTSTARLDGNLVDGPIRSRDGGLLHLGDNRSTALWESFAGWHRVRALFAAPQTGDFSWAAGAPLREREAHEGAAPGLCGKQRVARPAYGAFDDFGDCLAAQKR
jgi:parallel beta-helix repeat protein